ncbi:MAG: hypothetical protein AAF961_00640 [Planctomycetota bacterium]
MTEALGDFRREVFKSAGRFRILCLANVALSAQLRSLADIPRFEIVAGALTPATGDPLSDESYASGAS